MPIILKKNEEGVEPRKPADDVVVLSAMDKRIEQKLVTPQRVAIAVGAVLLVVLSIYTVRVMLSGEPRTTPERV